MKKVSICIIFAFAMLLLVGCAGGPSARWAAKDVNSSLKGQTEEQIIARFGQPDRQFSNSGRKVFEYKKATEGQNAGVNQAVKWSTLGLYQQDSFVDMMRIIFRKGRVVDYSYDENVIGFASLPGGGAPSSTSDYIDAGRKMTDQYLNGERVTVPQKKRRPPHK